MFLDLDAADVNALRRALGTYLPSLAEEAARTDRVRDAHDLWDLYRLLDGLRGRLEAAADAGGGRAELP
jgi:hypothetical protein